MNKTPTIRNRTLSAMKPATRELVQQGLAAATKISATAWIGLVAILAILLAGYAIHAVVSLARP